MNNQELNFAYKIRHALNESLDNLPENVTERLVHARQIAIKRKKADSPLFAAIRQTALAGNVGAFFQDQYSWLRRMGLTLPALVLVCGLMGIYQYEEQHQIRETADIDVAVLSDELPPSAYADSGFKVYLERRGG
jgi:hypothetical protein